MEPLPVRHRAWRRSCKFGVRPSRRALRPLADARARGNELRSAGLREHEVFAQFGSPALQARWLEPLLDGTIRSAYSMTEPEVASSDANNIATRIELDETSDELVLTGRKWWSSGAMAPEWKVSIVMGLSTPQGERHLRLSMVAILLDTPGVHVERSTHLLGFTDAPHGGHAEIQYDAVRVPRENLVGEWNGGFAIGQARRASAGSTTLCVRSAWPSVPTT